MYANLSELTANVLVGAVSAILLAVTEETSLDARSVTAREITILAKRFLGVEQGLGLSLLVLQFAVVDGVLPIARLLVDVEVQTGRTSYRLQTGTCTLNNVAAIITLAGDQSEPFAGILILADLIFKTLLLLLLLSLNSIRAL